mgnify:CR=1 FL=1
MSGGSKFIPEELKNCGLAVIAVNYRLLPKATLSDCIDDAAAAVAWTFSEKELADYIDRRIADFDAYCQTNFDQIYANGKQSEQLSLLRDALLPKLMSGELDVSAIEL